MSLRESVKKKENLFFWWKSSINLSVRVKKYFGIFAILRLRFMSDLILNFMQNIQLFICVSFEIIVLEKK